MEIITLSYHGRGKQLNIFSTVVPHFLSCLWGIRFILLRTYVHKFYFFILLYLIETYLMSMYETCVHGFWIQERILSNLWNLWKGTKMKHPWLKMNLWHIRQGSFTVVEYVRDEIGYAAVLECSSRICSCFKTLISYMQLFWKNHLVYAAGLVCVHFLNLSNTAT